MGIGFKKGAGDPNPLNYKVVGNPQPSNPKENTIWVDSDVKITSYIFSATEPEAPVEGMVWISTGTSSLSEFNALKKNSIQVYPRGAKQYVGSAWVDKTAKSYQGGAWAAWWDGPLFDNGDQYEAVTGGWKGSINSKINISTSGGNAYTSNLIDLSGYKTLYAKVGSATGGSSGSFYVGIYVISKVPSSTSVSINSSEYSSYVLAQTLTKSVTTISVDIANISVPVCIACVCHPSNGSTGTFTEIWVE